MSSEENLVRSKKTFETLCQFLDEDELRYSKDEENLSISFVSKGDDLPIDITVNVDSERMLIILLSQLPFDVEESKRLELAVAVSLVNYRLLDGSFDYNIKNGHTIFRMSNSFRECEISKDLFRYMVFCSYSTIDDFNDKFFALAKGFISLEKFIESVNNQE